MSTMQVYAQAILDRDILESISNPSSKIPYFMKKVYGNIIMEAIGKPQYRFCAITLMNDNIHSYILYSTKGRHKTGKMVKTDDLIGFFGRKKIEVSISVMDMDSE